jgi:hypothetical protein
MDIVVAVPTADATGGSLIISRPKGADKLDGLSPEIVLMIIGHLRRSEKNTVQEKQSVKNFSLVSSRYRHLCIPSIFDTKDLGLSTFDTEDLALHCFDHSGSHAQTLKELQKSKLAEVYTV